MDENTQYFFLSTVWILSKPVWVLLIPYVTFSLFHTLNFLRAELLTSFFPAGSKIHTTYLLQPTHTLRSFSQNTQPLAMKLVSHLEVFLIFPYLVLLMLVLKAPILMPFAFFQFLRFRYFFSELTREAFGELKQRLDSVFMRKGRARWVQAVYLKCVELVVRYGDADAEVQRRREAELAMQEAKEKASGVGAS
ncbi:hypothetical protein HDV05_002134 [Chytridiales sp. JEL 0842]|nr:hypothetical protein HDV05_002134 [Chytridiales sp. JEL 0842]